MVRWLRRRGSIRCNVHSGMMFDNVLSEKLRGTLAGAQ